MHSCRTHIILKSLSRWSRRLVVWLSVVLQGSRQARFHSQSIEKQYEEDVHEQDLTVHSNMFGCKVKEQNYLKQRAVQNASGST